MTPHFISTLSSELPEFLSSLDLVDLGLYPTQDAVYLSRLHGTSPDYIKLGRKVLYPKHCVLKFIADNFRSGNKPAQSVSSCDRSLTC